MTEFSYLNCSFNFPWACPTDLNTSCSMTSSQKRPIRVLNRARDTVPNWWTHKHLMVKLTRSHLTWFRSHYEVDCSPVCYLERCVDPTDQCVQNVHVVMCVQQDEGQEGLEEDGLRDGAQKQIQVRSGGHHLLHCQLHTHTHYSSCKHACD